jgi:transposase
LLLEKTMSPVVIGIDIAKPTFAGARRCEGKYQHAKFTNDTQGHIDFIVGLTGFGDDHPLIGMEATGVYRLPLAEFLADRGHAVSVVNPARIHAFAQRERSRAKTDRADAKLIARYALAMRPRRWTPPPPHLRERQARGRRVEHRLERQQMERNRRDTADAAIIASINAVLAPLEVELKAAREAIRDPIDHHPELKPRHDLLDSIPGMGPATIAHLLVARSPHQGFTHPKQAVAYAGLAPRLRESGQWTGKTRIAKTGAATLRKAWYLPALVAEPHNPVIRAFCERLKATGKNGKVIACAAMRKLIHIAFAILKPGQPFDPNFALA